MTGYKTWKGGIQRVCLDGLLRGCREVDSPQTLLVRGIPFQRQLGLVTAAMFSGYVSGQVSLFE